MLLSEFANKKIINMYDGEIIGMAGECDLLIDEESGRITEITAPGKNQFLGGASKKPISIPWAGVRKIGSEIIIVEVNEQGQCPE